MVELQPRSDGEPEPLDGPYFEDLAVGQVFDGAPAVTLTAGHAAVHQARQGRWPTGLAVLRIRTVDQHERPVLDFPRCAMLPLAEPDLDTGHRDVLDGADGIGGQHAAPADLTVAVGSWRLAEFRQRVRGAHVDGIAVGQSWRAGGRRGRCR